MTGGTMNTAKPINSVAIPTQYDEYISTTEIIKALDYSLLSSDDRTALEDLLQECRDNVADCEYGATLIRYSEFANYTREIAEDTSTASFNEWPYAHIDWDRAADDLLADYVEVTFRGISYYGRYE
jgi:hypothetical protein